MAARKVAQVAREKKLFSVAQANATLPLVKAIVGDIAALASNLRERHDRLNRVQTPVEKSLSAAHREEVTQAEHEFERDQERLVEYVEELNGLGVELKDYYTGLVDFPCWHENRVVLLCWRLGEPEVAYWHEVDSGFAGRQRVSARMTKDQV
jgi:hypothetical protein